MSKKRLKFSKLGMGKYISHLDLLRTFTRAIMRAGLPVKYTQGFNPHQIISFSLPLPIGVTSESEYVDIDFEDTISDEDIKNRLNENLPMDIRILSVSVPGCKANDIVLSEYVLGLITDIPLDYEKVHSFFKEGEITITKKTKKGEKEVNLMNFVHSYTAQQIDDKTVKLNVKLSSGNSENIKPELLVNALEDYISPAKFEVCDIHRINIYYLNNGGTKIFC